MGLSCSKHGSRVVDSLFNNTTLNGKLEIASELSSQSKTLLANLYGKIIHSNLNLKNYDEDPEMWKLQYKNKNKTKDMFKDILSTEGEYHIYFFFKKFKSDEKGP